jgi:hypothetical protein
VIASFVLLQNNWSFDSGKTNGVMLANVIWNSHHPATIDYFVYQRQFQK